MQTGAAILMFFMATIKFLFSPPVGLGAGIDFWTVLLIQFAGGTLGVLFFFFLFKTILETSRKRMVRKRREALENGKIPRKIFSRKNRKIIKWKHKLGYYGVVFIALPFVSIPIEGLLCAKFFKHERTLIPMLIVSSAAWSFILVTFYKYMLDGIRAYFF